MDAIAYLILILGLLVLLYAMASAGRKVRQGGLLRFTKALGILVVDTVSAVVGLVTGSAGKRSKAPSEPLDLSGTGRHYNARTGNYDNGRDPFGIYPGDDRHS